MFSYGFYNSLNGDRKYDAVQVSSIFDGVIEDGVYSNIGEFFAVVPGATDLQVTVKTGRAWFNHTWSINDSYLPLDIDPPDVLQTRIDAVVLEIDSRVEKRENSIKIVRGVPSVNPLKPNLLNTGGVYQHALAYITIKPETALIKAEDIEIVVGKSETPFVQCPLRTVSIDDLFNQWDGEFNTWFDNIKLQLTDNVVTNLQRQIDENGEIIQELSATTSQFQEKVSSGISNGTGAGSLFFVEKHYSKPIKDALICNGKNVSYDQYPVLFDALKGSYGMNIEETAVSSQYGITTSNYPAIYNADHDLYIYAKAGKNLTVYRKGAQAFTYTNIVLPTPSNLDVNPLISYSWGDHLLLGLVQKSGGSNHVAYVVSGISSFSSISYHETNFNLVTDARSSSTMTSAYCLNRSGSISTRDNLLLPKAQQVSRNFRYINNVMVRPDKGFVCDNQDLIKPPYFVLMAPSEDGGTDYKLYLINDSSVAQYGSTTDMKATGTVLNAPFYASQLARGVVLNGKLYCPGAGLKSILVVTLSDPASYKTYTIPSGATLCPFFTNVWTTSVGGSEVTVINTINLNSSTFNIAAQSSFVIFGDSIVTSNISSPVMAVDRKNHLLLETDKLAKSSKVENFTLPTITMSNALVYIRATDLYPES